MFSFKSRSHLVEVCHPWMSSKDANMKSQKLSSFKNGGIIGWCTYKPSRECMEVILLKIYLVFL